MKRKREHVCFEGPTILYFGFWFVFVFLPFVIVNGDPLGLI